MKAHWAVLLLLWLLLAATAAGAEDMTLRETTARVWVDGREIDTVYETAVCHQRYWEENPALSTTPVAIAVTALPARVEIDFPYEDVTEAVVRPLSLGIEAEIQDGRIVFTADRSANLTVEVNGKVEGALHLFVDTPDEEKPDPEGAKVRYFGPGVYRDQMITVRSNETIYLDEGCVLYGQIYCGMGKQFTIAGHGVLCGSIYDRWKDTIVPINISNCSDFTIRDITILDPSAWTVNLLKCKDARIENVKIVSARSNSDGFTFQNCERIEVDGCFVRSWDDSLVVKGYGSDVHDIVFQNCTLWTDLAQSCEIGYETRAKVIDHITFRDITVLHNFHKPVISIHNSDHAAVSHVLFENITVEDAQMGEGDGSPYLIELTTTESVWSATLRRGTIDDVEIRNVQVLSGKKSGIRIYANDETSWIDHVQIQDLTLLGEQITDFSQITYETSPFNGSEIHIGVTDIPVNP
ncbi:MAG: hypothetical protein IJ865_03645 [Clostridia bacterium]|nr:hypothetical protein [Clostridia bacterium]